MYDILSRDGCSSSAGPGTLDLFTAVGTAKPPRVGFEIAGLSGGAESAHSCPHNRFERCGDVAFRRSPLLMSNLVANGSGRVCCLYRRT